MEYLRTMAKTEEQNLYKFLSSQYADALVSHGKIRIGTLYDFRRAEVHGEERGDELEGIRVIENDGQPLRLQGNSSLPRAVRPAVDLGDWGVLDIKPGARVRFEIGFPDRYVYCTSKTSHSEVGGRFGSAVIEIHDAARFFGVITSALATFDGNGVVGVTSFRLAACRYAEREESWPGALHTDPELQKPPRYAHQQEVRGIWSSPRVKLSPTVLYLPELHHACRRIR